MATPFESGCDPVSPNRNLAPVSSELDDLGRLMVGGCRLSELAERYGTPLYVLDEVSIRASARINGNQSDLKLIHDNPATGHC